MDNTGGLKTTLKCYDIVWKLTKTPAVGRQKVLLLWREQTLSNTSSSEPENQYRDLKLCHHHPKNFL